MRTVLYVNTPTYTGGAEISLLTLMRHLDPARYVPLLVTSGEGQLAEAARAYGIETLIQDFPWFRKRYPWRYPASILRLAGTVRTHRVALVHTNCDRSLVFVRWACSVTQTPYVSHVRDCVRSWFDPQHLAALNRAERVIANCKAITSPFVESGVKAELMEVVYNPVDTAAYSKTPSEARAEFRRSLGIALDSYVVGLVGQVQFIKGQEDLIQAASKVVAAVSDAHFLIIGDANDEHARTYLDHLRKLVQELNLSGRVHFLGFRNDIPEAMQGIDVLAVPSRPEYNDLAGGVEKGAVSGRQLSQLRQIGFGRVVFEGMAAGRAVVATELNGMLEILKHSQNGLLVPPGDIGALADALLLLAQDIDLRDRLAAEGFKTAQQFSAESHAAQVQSIYDSVIERWSLAP